MVLVARKMPLSPFVNPCIACGDDDLTAVIDRVRLLNMPTGGRVNYLIEIRRHAIVIDEGIEDFQRYYSPIRLTRPTKKHSKLAYWLFWLRLVRQVMRRAVEPNDVPFAVNAQRISKARLVRRHVHRGIPLTNRENNAGVQWRHLDLFQCASRVTDKNAISSMLVVGDADDLAIFVHCGNGHGLPLSAGSWQLA